MAFRKVIEVAVREKFLRVNDDRYPLANIARVRAPKVKIKLWGAFEHIAGRLLPVAVLVVVVAVGAELTLPFAAGTFAVWIGVSFVLAAVAAFLPLHALVVETTGPPAAIVVSMNRAKILDCVDRITHAINNPQAEFEVSIEKFQLGDNIFQVGKDNIVNKGAS